MPLGIVVTGALLAIGVASRVTILDRIRRATYRIEVLDILEIFSLRYIDTGHEASANSIWSWLRSFVLDAFACGQFPCQADRMLLLYPIWPDKLASPSPPILHANWRFATLIALWFVSCSSCSLKWHCWPRNYTHCLDMPHVVPSGWQVQAAAAPLFAFDEANVRENSTRFRDAEATVYPSDFGRLDRFIGIWRFMLLIQERNWSI